MGLNGCINECNKLAPYLSHNSIRITEAFPPFAWDFTDEIPSPNWNDATLRSLLAKTVYIRERYGRGYHNTTFWEVVHGHGKRILDPHRKISEGTVTETADGHRHDVDHEMAEEVETLERLFSTGKLEHLKKSSQARGRSGGEKACLDQITGRIVNLRLKEIDMRRYVMGYVPPLAD
jgi:hypothetical protein